MLKVIKRDGKEVDFNEEKIIIAIEKAMNSSTGVYEEGLAAKIANEIKEFAATTDRKMTIYEIEDHVY